jgi:hypothetical protein
MELSDYLSSLSLTVIELDTALTSAREKMTLEEAADILVALNRHRDDVKIVYDSLSHLVGQLMNQQSEMLAGDGTKIEKKGDVNRTGWKHKDLANEVVSRLSEMAIDTSTGEVMLSSQEMAMKMLDYIQPSYWRIKELSTLGINADNFSKVGEYKESIIVRKAKL